MFGNLKKVISLILVCTLLLQLGVSAFASGTISLKLKSKSVTVVDLTRRGVIQKAGLPASGLYTKSGNYTAELSGKNLKKNFSFSTRSDWSAYNTLSMWVYSPVGVKTPVTFVLVSENPETSSMDYYYATEELGQLGWNLISLPYDEENSVFIENGKPKGFSDIDRVEIWTNFDGQKASSDAQLYLDKMTIASLTEEEVSEVINNTSSQGGSSGGDVADENGTPAGSVEVYGNFTLGQSGVGFGEPAVSDWTPYNTLVIRATTTQPSTVPYLMWIESQTEETRGNDYWFTHFQFDWTGTSEIAFDFSYGIDLASSGSPMGADKINGLRIQPGSYSINTGLNEKNFSNGYPTVTIDSIYLTNRDWKETVYGENSGNYILPAKLEEGFYDYAADARENGISHPRLLLDGEYMKSLKSLVKTDRYLNSTFAELQRTADEMVKKGPIQPNPEGGCSDIPGVVLVYNITGDEKYGDWIWESLYNITAKSDTFCTGVYLNVGDKLRELSICYDWMYNHWTEEQRRIVRNGLMHLGIEYIIREARCWAAFTASRNNLGMIMNSGLGMAALAMMGDDEDYDDILNESLNRCMISLRDIMPDCIEPTGEFREGTAYWSYGVGNFLKFVSSMSIALGDTELMDIPGMTKTGLFPIALSGSVGSYNFGDGFVSSAIGCGGYFFLSQYNDDPMYGAYQIIYGGKDYFSLAAYRPDSRYDSYDDIFPTSTYFADTNEILTIRKNWANTDAFSAAFKAGGNITGSHMQYDIGSFIFDTMGERWISELGRDDYNLEDKNPLGRDGMYRIRAEGNNCLVINPDETPGQNTNVSCKIEEYKVTDSAAYAVMDLSEAYEGYGVSSVKRGFAVLNNFGSLLIQDEIKTNGAAEIYSFMHTVADIDIAGDGKSAVLELNGKKMRAKLLAPADASLTCMEADYLPTSNVAPCFDNSAYKKLTVHLTDAKNPTISVLLTPYQENIENEFSIDEVVALRSFKNYLKYPVYAEQLYLDGVPLNGFNRSVSGYFLNENEVGTITVDASEELEVTIKQAEELGDSACVTIVSPKSKNRAVYTVTFSDKLQSTMEASSYKPAAILTSDGLSGALAMDGDTTTGWGKGEPCWIGVDLGSEKELTSLKVMWSQGSQRYAYFSIEVSNDANNWTTVYDGQSYMTDGFETYSFEPVNARYIRLCGTGNSTNSWTTLYEMRVTSYEDAFSDIAGHWAKTEIQNLANIGIITGDADGRYNPEAGVTRAEFITLLQKVSGFAQSSYAGTFSDVPADAAYMGSIEGAHIVGIIPQEMIVDGKLLPEKLITCEEMMALSVNAYNLINNAEAETASLDGYQYAENISEWCVPYMENAKACRLLGGNLVSNGFNPTQNATKAQATVLAKRVYIKTH